MTSGFPVTSGSGHVTSGSGHVTSGSGHVTSGCIKTRSRPLHQNEAQWAKWAQCTTSVNQHLCHTFALDLLSMQKNYICYQRKSRETRCKPICLRHCFTTFNEVTNKNICSCYTHGLLQGQICPLTLNLYYYQINKFKGIISHLLSVQIRPSSPNWHTY